MAVLDGKVAFDIGEQIDSVPYSQSSDGELAKTVHQVQVLGRRIVAVKADVRDQIAVEKVLPVPLIEAQVLANAVAWLASDEARYVTGAIIPIDAGASAR